MSYRVFTELSPKPFLPGDRLEVSIPDDNSSFYLNLEDWDGRYKFYIQIDQDKNTLITNELLDGEWKTEFKLVAGADDSPSDPAIEISYGHDSRYHINFAGCKVELASSYWPGHLRQVGGEADGLKVTVVAGNGHTTVDEQQEEIADELANEMLT